MKRPGAPALSEDDWVPEENSPADGAPTAVLGVSRVVAASAATADAVNAFRVERRGAVPRPRFPAAAFLKRLTGILTSGGLRLGTFPAAEAIKKGSGTHWKPLGRVCTEGWTPNPAAEDKPLFPSHNGKECESAEAPEFASRATWTRRAKPKNRAT
ncbi:hypothetical protein GCM10010497_62190 [Streptomyces cinereoruber]|uniref:Uncharacterized protein n=1 Tax=Streptomyces cinereoruber TaxID=67260 RepID=A0AAV4KR59_9ACTN|nr:hypothetical protein GCM10010497_62190 [Streptomyces cinereoruber]